MSTVLSADMLRADLEWADLERVRPTASHPTETPARPAPAELPDRADLPDPEREVSAPLFPCACGSMDCEWTDDDVERELFGFGVGPDGVPHATVAAITEKLLGLYDVCDFFHDHVARSVQRFHPLAPKYPIPVAVKAIREGVNTWNGCPEDMCRD